MKYILCLLIAVAAASCSRTGFDPAETRRLCDEFDENARMSSDDIDRLMTQEEWAFEDRRVVMEDLLDKKGELDFSQEYVAARNDTAFVAMVTLSERAWRVLVLSQPHFSDADHERFAALMDSRSIVDLLEDEISRRLSRE